MLLRFSKNLIKNISQITLRKVVWKYPKFFFYGILKIQTPGNQSLFFRNPSTDFCKRTFRKLSQNIIEGFIQKFSNTFLKIFFRNTTKDILKKKSSGRVLRSYFCSSCKNFLGFLCIYSKDSGISQKVSSLAKVPVFEVLREQILQGKVHLPDHETPQTFFLQ